MRIHRLRTGTAYAPRILFVQMLVLLTFLWHRQTVADAYEAVTSGNSANESIASEKHEQSSPLPNNNNSSNLEQAPLPITTNPILDTIVSFFQNNNNRHRQRGDDITEDSFFDPIQADDSILCTTNDGDIKGNNDTSSTIDVCNRQRWSPPDSTIEEVEETVKASTASIDATCSYGGADPDASTSFVSDSMCQVTDNKEALLTSTKQTTTIVIDKHWGSDPTILRMRDQLRQSGSGCSNNTTQNANKGKIQLPQNTKNRRPPIFLMPGLASTRLVAWRYKSCPHHPLLSDIRVQDYVWLNINLIMQMSTIDVSCMSECLRLGRNQTDTDNLEVGCKLRPDEGLDAISSLSPGGIGSQLLVGGTNTVYAWLIQWCADNMGYDVSNIVGLPYDWRLSPDKMEQRDGFLTLTRRRIEAAVQTNGEPGIMVAHSMGNSIFRYFLLWIRKELQEEVYQQFIRKAQRRAKVLEQKQSEVALHESSSSSSNNSSITTTVQSEKKAIQIGIEIGQALLNGTRHRKLWELAQIEGDVSWYEWIEKHIWTYVGLSAPLLGAVNPLRAVISGENMGLPVTDHDARIMELTFGSTHTVNPISTKNAFRDEWDIYDRWDEEPIKTKQPKESKLACLDDIMIEIEEGIDNKNYTFNPWKRYPALKSLLRDRVDWDTNIPMVRIVKESCKDKEKRPCATNYTTDFGPSDVENGKLFTDFNQIFKEANEPMIVKRDQLRESFWDTDIPNILNETWERPLIKHVIMAYGVDLPTEIAYEYVKTERDTEEKRDGNSKTDNAPTLTTVYWETAGGALSIEQIDQQKSNKLTDFWKKKQKREPFRDGKLHHSGDGSVPYLSLAWSHTWLLHSIRAQRFSGHVGDRPLLDEINIRHRPEGATEWVDGPPPNRKPATTGEKKVEESSDTGTAHPHGTKYKPEMVRYHNVGISRTTGIEYTTTVIEALAVEHKETTRNYDILAAVFTDVLKYMHDDLNII